MPLIHSLAVTTRSIKLSKILSSEIGNRNSSTTIVLNDLIRSTESSTSVDECSSTSGLNLDGESVFADCGSQDVGEYAYTLAMNTLDLVGINDDVGEGAAFFDIEDCVGVSALGLTGATGTAVEHDHSAVK